MVARACHVCVRGIVVGDNEIVQSHFDPTDLFTYGRGVSVRKHLWADHLRICHVRDTCFYVTCWIYFEFHRSTYKTRSSSQFTQTTRNDESRAHVCVVFARWSIAYSLRDTQLRARWVHFTSAAAAFRWFCVARRSYILAIISFVIIHKSRCIRFVHAVYIFIYCIYLAVLDARRDVRICDSRSVFAPWIYWIESLRLYSWILCYRRRRRR